VSGWGRVTAHNFPAPTVWIDKTDYEKIHPRVTHVRKSFYQMQKPFGTDRPGV
jgi:hypothetical protein